MATNGGAGGQSQSSGVLDLPADMARRYVRDVAEQRVAPSEAAMAALAELHQPFPPSPSDPSDVIERLDRIGSAATGATTGGRYFGFVVGGMVAAPMPSHWPAAPLTQNASLRH